MILKLEIKDELLPGIVQEMGFDANNREVSAEQYLHDYVGNWLASLAKQNVRNAQEQLIQQQIEANVRPGDVKKVD